MTKISVALATIGTMLLTFTLTGSTHVAPDTAPVGVFVEVPPPLPDMPRIERLPIAEWPY